MSRLPRVFVVEDDELVRRRLSQVLREAGYAVVEADSGALLGRARAVSEGRELPDLDLVVCDTFTLGAAGRAALKKLRRLDWVLPIVLLAPAMSHGFRSYARELHAHGLSGYPVKPERVRTMVEQVIMVDQAPLRPAVPALEPGSELFAANG